ncbi:MAG: hypothetical protein JAZ19_19145, partial [Candidatus Thiodiazotropha taylori]|nr:hypothetical protein [Candidatus Thiodiazotropha taylori]
IKTDGCVRVLSVKDQSAEPTGFEFFGNGKVAVVAIQHSNDDMMSDYDDYGTDDIVLLTGFKLNKKSDD